MSFWSGIDTSASGLTAERMRLDVIADNLANVNTTRTEKGEPFRRRMLVFEARGAAKNPFLSRNPEGGAGSGVRVSEIKLDQAPFRTVYDPSHPDANKQGYVSYPNVNSVREMVDMITASRAYEANATALNAAKAMLSRAVDISATRG